MNGQALLRTFGEKSSLIKKKERKEKKKNRIHGAYTVKLHKVRGGNNRVSLLERAMQKKKKEKREGKRRKKRGSIIRD